MAKFTNFQIEYEHMGQVFRTFNFCRCITSFIMILFSYLNFLTSEDVATMHLSRQFELRLACVLWFIMRMNEKISWYAWIQMNYRQQTAMDTIETLFRIINELWWRVQQRSCHEIVITFCLSSRNSQQTTTGEGIIKRRVS